MLPPHSKVRATLTVYDLHPHRWSEFFSGLASNWSGWDGERVCESIEHQLRIACKADQQGHVAVRVHLGGCPEEWRVEKVIHVEAGQLDDLARKARRYFG